MLIKTPPGGGCQSGTPVVIASPHAPATATKPITAEQLQQLLQPTDIEKEMAMSIKQMVSTQATDANIRTLAYFEAGYDDLSPTKKAKVNQLRSSLLDAALARIQ